MRDPARIEKVLELVAAVWKEYPDMRLAQLIYNIANTSQPCPGVFYLEDEELVGRLEYLLARLRGRGA